jgi:hypothetical protein
MSPSIFAKRPILSPRKPGAPTKSPIDIWFLVGTWLTLLKFSENYVAVSTIVGGVVIL